MNKQIAADQYENGIRTARYQKTEEYMPGTVTGYLHGGPSQHFQRSSSLGWVFKPEGEGGHQPRGRAPQVTQRSREREEQGGKGLSESYTSDQEPKRTNNQRSTASEQVNTFFLSSS